MDKSTDSQETITKWLLEGHLASGDDSRESSPEVTQRSNKRDRKFTEKGKDYKLDCLNKDLRHAHSNMSKQVKAIHSLLDKEMDPYSLEAERNKLDKLKEAYIEAYTAMRDLSESKEEKEALYRDMDLCDRQYTECRLKICERLQKLEKESQLETISFKSHKSTTSKASSRNSKSSTLSRKLDAVAKAAKLKVEMQFLEQEKEIRKLQIQKEIALANAEADVMNKVLEEEKMTQSEQLQPEEDSRVERKSASDDVLNTKPPLADFLGFSTETPASKTQPIRNSETIVDKTSVKKEVTPEFSPIIPAAKTEPQSYSMVGSKDVESPLIKSSSQSTLCSDSTLKELIKLQQRQTELSAILANQQRISSLPVQEPPTFDGNFFDYPIFIRAFETIIENKVSSDRDRLYFLSKYTTGKANEIVKGFVTLDSDDGYKEARRLLAKRFGDPFHVAQAYKNKLKRWPQINEGDGVGVQSLSDYLVRCKEAMRTMHCLDELNSSETIMQISAKLPSYTGIKWCRHAHDIKEKVKKPVSFNDLVEFVKIEAELATDPVFSPDALKRERNKDARQDKEVKRAQYNKRSSRANTFYTSTTVSSGTARQSPSDQKLQCPSCSKNHDLEDCAEFKKISVEERVKFVMNKGLCFGCYGKEHRSKDCKSRRTCKVCGKRHPTTLHQDSKNPPEAKDNTTTGARKESERPAQSVSNCATANESSCQENTIINSMIVPVWLHHEDNPDHEILVYALLDEASDSTFIKASTLEKLGISGTEIKLNLYTMHGKAEIPTQRVNGLVVKRVDKRVDVKLPRAYSRSDIPSRRDQIPRPETADAWPHLRKIKEKIPPYQDNLEVGLLIGCDCPKAIKPKEVIAGKTDDPYAIRSYLGWGILGPVSVPAQSVQAQENNGSVCNRTFAQEIPSSEHRSHNLVVPVQTKEIMNPSEVKRMFELDFSEVKGQEESTPVSKDDRMFMAKVEEGIRHDADGHYSMPLPLRDQNVKLPNNREVAVRRLVHLKRKFKADSKYKEHYITFMNNLVQKGYAEEVCSSNFTSTEEKQDPGRSVWYIPHHGVYHPKKQDKIRVVFDCSAEYRGESLNKNLLQGPDLTNNLSGVLCRFRKEPVAIMCDIEAMFHQVRVTEDCRDMLRFLWWEGGNIEKEPKEYRMTVHLFGATSSPGCCNFALKTTANDHEEEIGHAPAQFLREDFYVDDGLKSVGTAEEAVKLIESTKEMCKKGGFNLHKFTSNKKEVIAQIPIEDRAEDIKHLDLDHDALPIERALGMQWCIDSDTFRFHSTLKDRPCTRRGILSTVSSIYDPLGIVAPLLLEGKKILQGLCKEGISWDDPVPAEIASAWRKWKMELHELENLSISRCYLPSGFGQVIETQLHHFSDASVKGYGQCTYLRQRNEHGQIFCSFVFGKARVTPSKQVTVPRLELTAAVVSAKVAQQVRKELRIDNIKEFFWTDSTVVLGYIVNSSKRFHVFVANRVQQIQDLTSIDQWRYVNTGSNPADCASRGLTARRLLNSKWINGPDFLWKEEEEWPRAPKDDHDLSEDDPEVKKAITMATVTSKAKDDLLERLEYFSSWFRAKKSIALCIRYIKCLRERVRHKLTQSQVKDPPTQTESNVALPLASPITVQEMERAEVVILKAIQAVAFDDEILQLKGKLAKQEQDKDKSKQADQKADKEEQSHPRRGPLHKLDPFLDSDGILRVGGRLRRSSLPDKVKFPAILPRKAHVTDLVIRWFHEQVQHRGRSSTLNEVRINGYWIIGGSSTVGSLIVQCATCRKLRGSLQEQKMADLPEDRLEPAPPFSYCAVDYFGPLLIKEGRKELKRYGVLFTCMASRAVHIEIACSLETDAFINALRRFVCRRGPIRQLRSDRGTNFVGAKGELQQNLREMNHKKISDEMLKLNCDWFTFKFNVPAASHMGGVWERQIRSVRSILAALLDANGTQLNDESLRTFMCEAEAIINSRPLTTDSLNEPNALSPLTPSHLLTTKSKVILPPPGNFQPQDKYSRKSWRRVQHLSNEFWNRWQREYLLNLQQRPKWTSVKRDLAIGDVVILKGEDNRRNKWQLARVEEINKSQDGHVRTVKVSLADTSIDDKGKRTSTKVYLERPIHKCVLLIGQASPTQNGISTTPEESAQNLNDS